MGDYGGIGQGIDLMFKVGTVTILVSVPLAVWKLVDIAIWLYRNVNITFG